MTATKETLVDALRPLVEDAEERRRRSARRAAPTSSRCTTTTDRRPPARRSTLALVVLGAQLRRLGKQSAIYGLGGLVSRHPRGAPAAALHELPHAERLRQGRDARRADARARHRAPRGDLERVLPLLLRLAGPGRPRSRRPHLVLVHDGRWRRSGWSSASLVAPPTLGRAQDRRPVALVRAAFVGLWAQMNYEQLTSLFRVEERSVAFVAGEPRERADHDRHDDRCSSSATTQGPTRRRSSATSSER